MKNFLNVIFFILFVIAANLAAHEALSQSKHKIIKYSFADGLADEAAFNAAQDGLGFIWVRHFSSLSRFDGYQWKNYKYVLGDSLMQLPSPIRSLKVDDNGDLWVASNGGYLLKYDRISDGFIKYKPAVNSFIRSLTAEKTAPVVWIGTQGEGLYEFNRETQQTTHYLNDDKDSLVRIQKNYVYNIHNLDSCLYLFTRLGIWKFDKQSKTYSRPHLHPNDTALLHAGKVFQPSKTDYLEIDQRGGAHIIVKIDSHYKITDQFDLPEEYLTRNSNQHPVGVLDNQDSFWFLSKKGLFQYDYKIKSLKLIGENLGWSEHVMIDRDQNVWMFGRELGIRKVVRPELSFHVSPIKNLNGAYAGSLEVLKSKDQEYAVIVGGSQQFTNNIWTAPIKLDSVDVTPFKFKGQDDHPSNFYPSRRGKDHLWIPTWGRGVIGIPIDQASGLLATTGIRYFMHDPKNMYSINTDAAQSVYEDAEDKLWVGTMSGLSKIDLRAKYGAEGSVQRFNHDPADTNSLSSDEVGGIIPKSKEALWVLNGNGIDLYKDGIFHHVFKDRGSPNIMFKTVDGDLFVSTNGGLYVARKENNYLDFVKTRVDEEVFRPLEDKQKNLWLMAPRGLIFYDPLKELKIDFGRDFGRDVGPWNGELAQTTQGIIIFSTSNAIVTFDPGALKISKSKTYPILTSLQINNETPVSGNRPIGDDRYKIPSDITVLDELVLDYLHNNFTLEFSAMQMMAPEKNLYRHKLEGYDKDWIETNYKNRTATYTNLPAADYIFKVKASNHHGIWSDQEKTLKVKILPPPWRTWWAYTGYLMLVAGALVVARRNIVQRERLKSNLQLAKVEQEKEHIELEKAQEVDRVKTSFFTNISHEFRTPLTLIKGPVQNLLEEFADNPKVRDRLKLVERNSDLLLRLINQLLDLAKLESGSLKVEKTEGELNSFIRAIASSFESFARQKNIFIEVDVPANRCSALFDKDKLETILINLINNAIKFTPAGGSVSVIAGLTRDPDVLKLIVKDTGIGIPEDQQTKIFERFHQVSEAHKEVGTGIGLALVKELVTLMGGEIGVTSEVNKGSEFKIVLPIEVTSRQTTLTVVAPSPEGMSNDEFPRLPVGQGMMNNEVDSTKPHVLVVEDNTDLRHFIIDSLGNEFHFLEAENGRIGLDVATREVPDLIISDVMMPEMDGITMAGKIKNDKHTSHIPLILLTAKSSEDSKLSGLQSGADDYLTKPFNKNELLLKVRNGVNRQTKLREKLRAELLSTAPKVEVLSEDEKFLNEVKEKILERLSDEQLSVESLAEDIGMSRVQLYRKVTGLAGISVNELIRKLRLQRAAQLLQQNWGPVSQVAYEVGFSNLSYFSKVFKEEFGILPSEYGAKI